MVATVAGAEGSAGSPAYVRPGSGQVCVSQGDAYPGGPCGSSRAGEGNFVVSWSSLDARCDCDEVPHCRDSVCPCFSTDPALLLSQQW
eukprot:3102210-Rhodomonas_salina.1